MIPKYSTLRDFMTGVALKTFDGCSTKNQHPFFIALQVAQNQKITSLAISKIFHHWNSGAINVVNMA
jgi:hypothetical protein